VDSIYGHYIGFGIGPELPWDTRPIADILVRVPGPSGFLGSRYKVVPRNYKPGYLMCGNTPCTLEAQLQEIGCQQPSDACLERKRYGDGTDAEWMYAMPSERLASLNSPNSGDIIILANLKNQYHFDFGGGIPGDHGSLTYADAIVPVAFGFPGGTAVPNMLDPITSYLEGLSRAPFDTGTPGAGGAQATSKQPVYGADPQGRYVSPEAAAILRFFFKQ